MAHIAQDLWKMRTQNKQLITQVANSLMHIYEVDAVHMLWEGYEVDDVYAPLALAVVSHTTGSTLTKYYVPLLLPFLCSFWFICWP